MLRNTKKLVTLVAVILVMVMATSCTSGTLSGKKGDTLELTVWNTYGVDYVYKELDENIPEQWLLDKTGVVVKNIYGNDGGQWDAKLTKLVAGDNLPDIIWCQAAQGPAHFKKMDQLDKLWLLDDAMLKKYAPNIWKTVPSNIWDTFRNEDGKITGIPFDLAAQYIDEVYPEYSEEEKTTILNSKVVSPTRIMTSLCIRDDILKMIYPEAKSYDELVTTLKEANAPIGDQILDVPIKTTEELIDFMYKIRDLNLVENGKKVFPFGYAGDGNDNWEAFVYLGNMMYGGNNHQYPAHWNTKTEKMEVPLVTDYVKQMAKTQNQMILDNVIDPESLAHTGAQFQAKVLQGKYAICSATRVGSFVVLNDQLEQSGVDYKYRPLYIDIPAPEGYEPFRVQETFQSSFCILKTLSEDEMIQVLKWADLQFTDEFIEVYCWGAKEDGLYTENADGTRKFNDESFNEYFLKGNSGALDVKFSKGLGNMANRLYVLPMKYSKWTPSVLNNEIIYTPTEKSGFKFDANSEYVTSLKVVPPCYAYSSEFSGIEEVVDFWARREEWEIAAKKTLAARKGEFEEKWNDMINVVNDIVDVEKMEKEMTKIARNIYKDINNNK